MDYSLKRQRADAFTMGEVVEELKRVAREFNGSSFSTRDFDRKASFSHQVVLRNFGTWAKALSEVGVTYKRKSKAPPNKIPDIELFNELERVWKLLGHRPSRQELKQKGGKYSARAYMERFGGWINACGKFIEYKSGQYNPQEGPIAPSTPKSEAPAEQQKKLGTRTIPLKLRFRVMNRDGYRCVVCGRSPATDAGIILHLDHIVAYSKGGQANEENLRTLCQHCNWGKGKD